MSTVPPRKTDDLETLARARFGDLTDAEVKLLRAAPNGEWAWCGPSHDDDDPANDPGKADDWGPEREIRADLIRWLCVDGEAASMIDSWGVQVHGARVTGALDLSFATVHFPLGLFRCRLTDNANLRHARIPALNLGGSWTHSLAADGIQVAGSIYLRYGFTAEGEVRLLNAQIGGDLDCADGTFKNPPVKEQTAGGIALYADCVRVGGSVFLRHGFTAEGEVRLLSGQIGHDVDCSSGTFKNPPQEDVPKSGKALSADLARVGGSVRLHEPFGAKGEVRLPGAQIGHSLDCSGGRFENYGGYALNANRAYVAGSVFLTHNFTAKGEVLLHWAQISCTLNCSGGRFMGPNGDALIVDGAHVSGDVSIGDDFTAEGTVRLLGCQIDGDLACDGGALTELNAQGAIIKGNCFWRDIHGSEATKLDLVNASAGAVMDNKASWPIKGNLRLDGFTYNRFSVGPRDAKSRLEWLARLNEFTPQPYRQLANVLRDTGDERGAHEVLYEMERLRRKNEDHRWYEHVSSWLLRWTIGYGHKMRRVVLWLLGLTLIGFALSGLGYLGGAIVPTQKDAFATFNKTGATPAYYPHFNAAIFSIEHSFPFVDLGERSHWAPAPGGSWRKPVFAWRVFQWMRDYNIRGFHPFRLNAPGFLRFWLWSQIAAGWILATLFVAGLTGIVKSR